MMKYLKAKFIIPALILIIAIILLLMYFVGALHANAATFNNMEYDVTDFTVANDIDRDDLNVKKLVGKNDQFEMYFNEDTTVITIVQLNGPGTEDDVYYTSANETYYDEATGKWISNDIQSSIDGSGTPTAVTSAMRSNFVVSFLDALGNKGGRTFNSFDYSVAFKNELTESYEKHYSFRYIEDENAVQVSYDIGLFNAASDYFPKYILASELEGLFRGNVCLVEQTAERKNGNVVYSGAYVYGVTAAQYIVDNGLAYEIYVNKTKADVDPDDETQNETTEYWCSFGNPAEGVDYYYDWIYAYGEYVNCDDSPLEINPFFNFYYWNYVKGCYTYENKSKDYVDENGNSLPFYYNNKLNSTQIGELYEYLYTSHYENWYDPSKGFNTAKNNDLYHKELVDENGDPVLRGGFQSRDEDGKFLYQLVDGGSAPYNSDNDSDFLRDDYGRLVPVQELYSLDLANEHAGYFNIDPVQLSVFRVALDFRLTESGMECTIIHNSLVDDSNYDDINEENLNKKYDNGCQLYEIEVLPFFTTSYLTDETDPDGNKLGEIIVPDGSGASIHFNNGARYTNSSAYKQQIYGAEKAHKDEEVRPTDTQKIMFPMYGFLNQYEKKGVMAVVTQGANMTTIYADVTRDFSKYNQAYFITELREREDFVLVYGWHRTPLTRYAAKLAPYDITYSYNILDNSKLTYSDLANEYRSFLMEQYGIVEKDTTSDHPVVNINFIGAYRHYVLTLGVIYYRKSALTSFSEAQAIVDELFESGITNMSVSYKGWSQDGLEPKLRKNLKTANCLGSKGEYEEFVDYLESHNIDFYPELNISYNRGYKYNFGGNKYTARGVGNVLTKMYDYDLSTLQYNKKSNESYIVSPKFYMDISKNYSKSYSKLGTSGIYLLDIGNAKIGDYHKGQLVYDDEAEQLISNVLGYWNEDYKVQLSAPFDYALGYASNVVEAPLTATLYPIIDDTIPFYELVLSGIVDYAGPIVNGTLDNSVDWFLAKSVETGSNLYFQFGKEDNSVLLETDYTQYYRVNYDQWKGSLLGYDDNGAHVKGMYEKLDESGIFSGRLVKHVSIAVGSLKIAYVEYSNGVKYYVNTNSRSVVYQGITIGAYQWVSAE